MSNGEPASVPVPIEPRTLLRVEPLPSERHPAAVYLASLGSGSRRTMRQSLGVIAGLLSRHRDLYFQPTPLSQIRGKSTIEGGD